MTKYINGSFKRNYPITKRLSESERILDKFPDRVPIIVEISQSSKDLPELDKHKYLVPGDLTVGQFQYVLRKRIKLKPEKAMYIFFDNTLAPTSEIIRTIYEDYKDEDKFLYCTVSGESTFGN